MMHKIAAIIVTYNRKELLAECLDAIGKQTYKPVVVYIIDNASSDGTDEWIRSNGYDRCKEGIEYRYVYLSQNIGGAGGFYTGLKTAYDAKDEFFSRRSRLLARGRLHCDGGSQRKKDAAALRRPPGRR